MFFDYVTFLFEAPVLVTVPQLIKVTQFETFQFTVFKREQLFSFFVLSNFSSNILKFLIHLRIFLLTV